MTFDTSRALETGDVDAGTEEGAGTGRNEILSTFTIDGTDCALEC